MKQQEKDGELNERASQTPSDWSGPRSGRSTERPGFVSVARTVSDLFKRLSKEYLGVFSSFFHSP